MRIEDILGEPSELPEDIREWLDRKKKRDEVLATVSASARTVKVLAKYGKKVADVRDVFYTLMAVGGEQFALDVIQSPKLLSVYLEMEAKGVPREEILTRLVDLLGGPNRPSENRQTFGDKDPNVVD